MSGGTLWEFDWDAANTRHLARHRISPSEFEQVMMHHPLILDFSDESGEDRWFALGATEGLRVLVLLFTYRQKRIRPITGWDADKKMRKLYFQRKGE
jgi:hypothetical protein